VIQRPPRCTYYESQILPQMRYTRTKEGNQRAQRRRNVASA
jgi:hypothetical protein